MPERLIKNEKPNTDFTRKQRDWIIRRDDGHSQMRHYSEEHGWYTNEVCPYDGKPCTNLEVNHIIPRRVGGEAKPENGITLYECEHNGTCKEGRIQNGKR